MLLSCFRFASHATARRPAHEEQIRRTAGAALAEGRRTFNIMGVDYDAESNTVAVVMVGHSVTFDPLPSSRAGRT